METEGTRICDFMYFLCSRKDSYIERISRALGVVYGDTVSMMQKLTKTSSHVECNF